MLHTSKIYMYRVLSFFLFPFGLALGGGRESSTGNTATTQGIYTLL